MRFEVIITRNMRKTGLAGALCGNHNEDAAFLKEEYVSGMVSLN